MTDQEKRVDELEKLRCKLVEVFEGVGCILGANHSALDHISNAEDKLLETVWDEIKKLKVTGDDQ